MTKLPQSRLGYCVNGVVVFRPTRHPQGTEKPEKLSRKQHSSIPRRRTKGSILNKPPSIDKLRLHPSRTDLKNASKQGSLEDAVAALHDLCCAWYSLGGTHGSLYTQQQNFELAVKLLFAPDMENRTALYYAAHAGKQKMVEVYLSLLVLAAAFGSLRHLPKEDNFPSWLERNGMTPYRVFRFSQWSFDLCYRSALNQGTRNVLKREKYTLAAILQAYSSVATILPASKVGYWFLPARLFVKDAFSNYTIRSEVPTRTKSKRPVLNTSDDLCAIEEDESNDFVSDVESDNDNATECDRIVVDLASKQLLGQPSNISTNTEPIWTEDDFPALGNDASEDFSVTSIDCEIAALEIVQDDSFSFTFVEEESSSFVHVGQDLAESVTSDWEAVEVGSGQSLNSEATSTLSFRDALRSGTTMPCSMLDMAKSKANRLAVVHTVNVPGRLKEESEDFTDPFSIVEGVKCARSGRAQYRFGKEPKDTRKRRYWNKRGY